MVLESRLRSLAHAVLSLAASGLLMACITEPMDELGAEGDPEAAEDLEADGYDDVVMRLGGSPAAAVAPVTLYQASSYNLGSQTLGPGVHDMNVLQSGIGNDTLSSLKVPSGMTVKLYEHMRYGGRTWTARADVPTLTGFHDITSSVAVYGPISEPAGSPHALGGYTDVENLKYKIASSSTLIKNLAWFAHYLGFAYCGGTQSPDVGRHFDVWRDNDGSYIINAHYDPNDPYAGGYQPWKRLRIRLKNFRITIDPSTFTYGTPVLTELTPTVLDQGFVTNASQTPSTVSVALSSSHTETYSHETSVSLTQGITVGITVSAGVPFFGEASASTEFSFSASQGWSNSSTTEDVVGTEWTYIAEVPPRSKKEISMLGARSKSDVSYTARAHVSFDIELNGFLRQEGNARKDHPTDRPIITLTFGSNGMSGFDHILDLYDHADIPNYSNWDWDWFKAIGYSQVGTLMSYFRNGITVPLSGQFSGVLGTTVWFEESAAQPL